VPFLGHPVDSGSWSLC